MTFDELRYKYFSLYPPVPYRKNGDIRDVLPENVREEIEKDDSADEDEIENEKEDKEEKIIEDFDFKEKKKTDEPKRSFYQNYKFYLSPADKKIADGYLPRPKLTKTQWEELSRKRLVLLKNHRHDNDEKIRKWVSDQVYNETMGYIVFCILKYSGLGKAELGENNRGEELVSVCYETVFACLDKYEGKASFYAYLKKWIKFKIKEAVLADEYATEQDIHFVGKVKTTIMRLKAAGIKNPTYAEISYASKLTFFQVKVAMNAIQGSEAIRMDDSEGIKIQVEDIGADPLKQIEKNEKAKALVNALASLSEEERDIVIYFYNLDGGGEPRSIAKTAKKFNISEYIASSVINKTNDKLARDPALSELYGTRRKHITETKKHLFDEAYLDEVDELLGFGPEYMSLEEFEAMNTNKNTEEIKDVNW